MNAIQLAESLEMVKFGLAPRNQARIKEGLRPVEGGDVFLVPGAMAAFDKTEWEMNRVRELCPQFFTERAD